jgi:hypothetical protein
MSINPVKVKNQRTTCEIEGNVLGVILQKGGSNKDTGEVYPNTIRLVLVGNKYGQLGSNTNCKVNGVEVTQSVADDMNSKLQGKNVNCVATIWNANKKNESFSIEKSDIKIAKEKEDAK